MKEEIQSIHLWQLMKAEKVRIGLGFALSIICSVLSFVPYYVIYQMIVRMMDNILSLKAVLLSSVITIIAAILQNTLLSFAAILTHTAAFNTMHKLRLKVIEHVSKLNLGFFHTNSPGKLKNSLFDDIARLENFIAHNTIEIAQVLFTPIFLFIILLIIQPIMAICMLIPAVLGVVLPMKMIAKYPSLADEYAKTMSGLSSAVNEYVHCMPIIKMYGLTATKFKKYSDSVNAYVDCLKQMAHYSCKPIAITIVILDSALLFTLPIGGILYLNGTITSGVFILFLLLTMCFYRTFFTLINMKMGKMELESGLMQVKDLISQKPKQEGIKTLDKNGCYSIDFEHVTFGYDKEKNVLSDVNIHMKPGTLTAFVGASGAGKTTAAQLIGGYWDVNKGAIKIDGIPIDELTTESLMDLTAFVFQDSFLLEDIIYENIKMGSNKTEAEVHQAAKAAQIHDFILSLPNGYETKIGDEGIKLSGGQKQRISIARAILKDAPIVIFDEATSYSDIENEHNIQLALSELLKNKTTIMIAHRLHTIRDADNIVVFDNGKVVEEGTHGELVLRNRRYMDMWNSYIGKEGKEVHPC